MKQSSQPARLRDHGTPPACTGPRAPWLHALLLLCALAACASTRSVPEREQSRPAPRERLVEVRWEGVNAIPLASLREIVRTEGAPELRVWERAPLPADDVLSSDAERIETLYRRRGYYSARARYRLEPGTNPRDVRVVFNIEEGPPIRVAERRIRFLQPAGAPQREPELPADFPLGPGAVFDVDVYRGARERLQRELGEHGYLGARISGGAEVNQTTDSARIDWAVETGPLVVQGPVQVEGLLKVDEQLVRRTLDSESGQLLSTKWIQERQQRLIELGLFRWATVQAMPPERGSSGPLAREAWPVAVRVSERPPRSVALAVGYATEENVRVRASWEHRNLLGGGRTLRVAARHSALLTSLEGSIGWPELLGPETRGELTATARTEEQESYDTKEVEVRTDLLRTLGKTWKGRIGHRLEIANTADVSDATEAELDDPEQTSVVSAIGGRLEHVNLDQPSDPRRGEQLRLAADLAVGPIGSQFDFTRAEVELRKYLPLGRTVLATRLQLGAVLPFGRTRADEIPLTERFFAGGGDSVRGFEYQKLGPLDSAGDPIGGVSLLLGSAELRFAVRGRLSAVVFVDGAQVATGTLDFKPSDALYSSGVGLRFQTPVGPVRIDYGRVLNPTDEIDRGRLHLAIGQAF